MCHTDHNRTRLDYAILYYTRLTGLELYKGEAYNYLINIIDKSDYDSSSWLVTKLRIFHVGYVTLIA